MPFQWSDYLLLARSLVDTSGSMPTEAAYRCAISRAYYAAFITARNYARDYQKKVFPTGDGSHSVVIHYYKNSQRSKVGTHLEKMKENRELADYEDVVHNLPILARTTIEYAQKVLDQLKPPVIKTHA